MWLQDDVDLKLAMKPPHDTHRRITSSTAEFEPPFRRSMAEN